jgi:ERCC4-type nuclease
MKIINLDEFRKGKVKVILGGKEYILPEQAPLGVTLTIMQYQEALAERDIEKVEEIIKSIYGVFAIENEIEYDYFKSLLDIETLVMIMSLMQGIDPRETHEKIQEIMDEGEKKSQSADSGKE